MKTFTIDGNWQILVFNSKKEAADASARLSGFSWDELTRDKADGRQRPVCRRVAHS